MERLLAGRYRLGDDIGAGGTARVVRALDERLGRTVAVKLLDSRIAASADPTGRERFLQECRTLAGFMHPGAVLVFDAGEDDGDLFLVMELVEGSTLAHRLADAGPMSVPESVRIAGEILGVLEAAHAAGIVHRDVKPANILLGENGIVKLADFGIAKRFEDIEESVTSTGFVVGTPRYLAPEQAMGDSISPATDVYAVGVLLYEMLAGHPPFVGDSAVAIALAQQATTAPDIRSVRPDVPGAVAVAIARSLALDPEHRPATAALLDEALHTTGDGPGTGDSSGDNASAHNADTVGWEPTMLMPDGRTGGGPDLATRVAPAAAMSTNDPTPRVASNRRLSSRAVIVVVLVAVTLAIAYALASGAGEELAGTETDFGTTVDSASAASTVPTVPTSAPPSTELPAVTAPPTPTEPPAPEIIPGFAVTEDLGTFLAQVNNDPSLVGSSGEELADKLKKVLDERGRKQSDLADELRNELSRFVEEGEVNAAVAAELDRLLAPLAGRGGEKDDD